MTDQQTEIDQDKDSQRRTDTIAEYELALGFRLRDVPEEVQKALRAEAVEAPTHVRFSRVNPFRRSEINKAVQSRFHKDLQTPEILSNAQVLKLVQERGEWSLEMQREMETLTDSTGRDMGRLWAEGLTPETTTFLDKIEEAVRQYRVLCEEAERESPGKYQACLKRFEQWASWSVRNKAQFPEGYDPGVELSALFDESPGVEAIEQVTEIDELKDKQERLIKLMEDRVRLAELQLKHSRIFSETAESRRDHTEELAQVYWTCERVTPEGKPAGRLAANFEILWNWPEAAIRWLLYEAYFFHNNVPDVARAYLGAFGFFGAERANIENVKSDVSPALPSSKIDGEPVDKTLAGSSELPADMTLTTSKPS
jgi:hypothetical protein